MLLTMLKAKLHRATVTEANLNYTGSITIDMNLIEAAGLLIHEQVHVVNINTGARFETYVIEGERGSGIVCLNGAAARLVQPDDRIIVMAYVQMTPEEAGNHHPLVFILDEKNNVIENI